LEKYVSTIIALHITRISDEKNNVKENNTLAWGGWAGWGKNPLRASGRKPSRIYLWDFNDGILSVVWGATGCYGRPRQTGGGGL
jgi:hypothetical protein